MDLKRITTEPTWPNSSSSPSHWDEPTISTDSFMYSALLALILVVSNSFNIFTITVFMKNRLLHTANNYLVASLAITDILHVTVGCQIPLLVLITEWMQHLQNSEITCRILGYVTHVFYSASTNTLVLISFHRLVSIVFSQKKIISTAKSAKRTVIILWVWTSLSCVPGLTRPNVYIYNPVLKTCTILSSMQSDSTFTAYSMILNFAAPLLMMGFFYFHIYKMLLHHKLSTVSEAILANGVIEKKSKRLIIAVLGIFTVTWLPFYIVLGLTAFSSYQVPSNVVILIWPLKMSSSMTNPILYAVFNRFFFRCMLRLWKCQGELRSRNHQTLCSNASNPSSCQSGENEAVSTIGPLPEPVIQCEHCTHCRDNYPFRRTYPGHIGMTYSSELETVPESTLTRPSTCSQCNEFSMSTQSSIPTILQLPLRESSGTSSSTYVFGPTPESQRSSFASQYPATPGCSRSSYYSNCPSSNRTSRNSNLPYHGTPRGSTSTCDIDLKRFPSFSPRQSLYSAMSMPRSTRSSVMSSRISHYAPGSSYSARSSMTSQYTTGSTVFSARPNTPHSVFVNTDVEVVCIPSERDSASSKKSSSTPSTRHSSDTTLMSEKIGCTRIPDQMDIFEDEEPVSGEASRKSDQSILSNIHSDLDVTRQKVSEFLLGDFCSDEDVADEDRRRKKKSHASRTSVSPHSTRSAVVNRDHSPNKPVCTQMPTSPCTSPRIAHTGDSCLSTVHEKSGDANPPGHILNSVGKAVNLVVKARRMRSKAKSKITPMKPDTPVPPHPVQRVPHVREPIRFVYETPYPCAFYGSKHPPSANTLSVPGRMPILNVPQTIEEEDAMSEYFSPSPSPEMPLTPRRKNASTWLNPPIIDVAKGDDDMRVECPGVLVEHHN